MNGEREQMRGHDFTLVLVGEPSPSLRADLVALMVDREEQARLDGLLDVEYDLVAADFYQLPPRDDLR